MSPEARWRSESDRVQADPRRKRYLQEYLSRPYLIRTGVTWGQFADLREAGKWNEWCDENLGGLHKVEG